MINNNYGKKYFSRCPEETEFPKSQPQQSGTTYGAPDQSAFFQGTTGNSYDEKNPYATKTNRDMLKSWMNKGEGYKDYVSRIMSNGVTPISKPSTEGTSMVDTVCPTKVHPESNKKSSPHCTIENRTEATEKANKAIVHEGLGSGEKVTDVGLDLNNKKDASNFSKSEKGEKNTHGNSKETQYIRRKENGKWGIWGKNTNKWWGADKENPLGTDYETFEKAKNAMAGFHARRG